MELGVEEVMNYWATPGWEAEACKLTPRGRGFGIIVHVGGHSPLPQTMKGNRVDGLIVLPGMLGQSDDPAPSMSIVLIPGTMRGIILGTRNTMRETSNS